LKLRDDGQGIKLEKLRKKILDSGKWSQNDVEGWDETELLYKIFEPGISTHDSSDYISGRGIGMDIIKYKLTKSKGNIQISHKPGSYCEFLITLPLSKN
jgi:chemotaxis protein histidine kinase CheA